MALQQLAAQERLDMQEALAFISKDAVELIQRSVAQAEANGGITDEASCAEGTLFRMKRNSMDYPLVGYSKGERSQ